MARDLEYEQKRKKSGTLFSTRNLIIFCLVFGLAFGMFLEHQYIEPSLGDSAKKLASCESTSKLLNGEIESCYKQLADLNSQKKC